MGGVGEPGLKGDKVIGTLPYCPWVIQVPSPPHPSLLRSFASCCVFPPQASAPTVLASSGFLVWGTQGDSCGGLMVKAEKTREARGYEKLRLTSESQMQSTTAGIQGSQPQSVEGGDLTGPAHTGIPVWL